MPYYRFNCDGSPEEPPARFATTQQDGLVHLRISRHSSTNLLTMTHEQADALGRMLMKEAAVAPPEARAHRRPRLAPYVR